MIDWEVRLKDHPSKESSAGCKKIQVSVTLDFKFFKSTWLQSTIESNTKAELMEVYELWINFANECLQHDSDMNKHQRNEEDALHRKQLALQDSTPVAPSKTTDDLEIGKLSPKSPAIFGTIRSSLASSSRDSMESASSVSKRGAQKTGLVEKDSIEFVSTGDEEEDLLFYDCEQGEHFSIPPDPIAGQSPFMNDSSSHNILFQRVVPPPTPPDLRRLYPSRSLESLSEHGVNVHSYDEECQKSSFDEPENRLEEEEAMINGESSHSSEDEEQRNSEECRKKRYQKQLRKYRHGSTRDKAIQVVETIFVLLEFSFWQVYQFYCYELKDLFDITSDRVWSRCINSFLPGWHGSILLQPDLYGPLLGVFFLPLTLLWNTQTSRHGCNPTSQLGNAVVVSLLIWIGLSGVYRGLSMILAPHIQYKHCLSMVGYSFICWNLALLVSLILEPFKDMLPLANAYLPLVFLGLPASIAQGLMFWEHAPSSSLTLQPSALPQSMQQCATSNARLIQRLLWALPKIVAFVLIAATHYQLLWYLARVFLPGRRQLCQLSALVRPTRYAEILAQKDLRVFAVQLLTRES
jgi:hypothetical protein